MLLADLAELLQEDTAELLLDNAEELDEDFGMLLEDTAELLLYLAEELDEDFGMLLEDIAEELDETTSPEADEPAVCSGALPLRQRTENPAFWE